jgi:hypothetical protein
MHPKVRPIRDGVTFLPLAHSSKLALPLFASRLHAGFPSPADDYLEGKIDLNLYLAEQGKSRKAVSRADVPLSCLRERAFQRDIVVQRDDKGITFNFMRGEAVIGGWAGAVLLLLIEEFAQSRYQIAAQILGIEPFRRSIDHPDIDALQPLGAIVEDVLLVLPVGYRPRSYVRFRSAGHHRGITSGIHKAKLPFLGVPVAPKLKHLD